MKKIHRLKSALSSASAAVTVGIALLAARTASANPFASCITVTNVAGTTNVTFYINEGGGSVTVTYEDGSTNASFNGQTTGTNVPSGPETFVLNGHSGYTITCHKNGTGTPFEINSTYGSYSYYPSGRGVDTDKNPKIGNTFGRVYVGNSTAGDSGALFKGRGIYMLTPDLGVNLAPGGGTNAVAPGVFTSASSSSPWHLTVGKDNNVYVADYSTANAAVYQFDPNFSKYTNVVIGPAGETQGFNAGTHGDATGVYVTGSLAQSNLVVYTWDPDLPTVYTNCLFMLDPFGNPIYHSGSEGQTTPGQFNNICQYVIGAGLTGVYTTNSVGVVSPVLWTNAPNKMVSTGLPNLQDVTLGDVTVETNGYTIAMYSRGNYSDGDIQVYDTNFNIIYTSLQNGADPFNLNTANGYYPYEGVRISPDNQYLMVGTIYNWFEVCFLTNGIPDVSSLMRIPTIGSTSGYANGRGCAWDAADNLMEVSSGQGLLEYFSLGYTSTCITSNDITGTNGTFSVSLPPVGASLAISQPTASQNYGSPIPAVFSINLNTSTLTNAVTVNFSLVGAATNNVNYTINTGTDPNGVVITSTNVTFPAGVYPGGGNWTVTVDVTPTASPVSGPTFTENVIIGGGTTYIPAEPISGFITIYNTGPQMLLLSAAPYGSTMSRSLTNDYAEFLITRYGDLNAAQYTVTNFTYAGTAVFPVDYTAGAQALSTPPLSGSPGIVIPTGVSVLTNIVGLPVPHANIYEPPTNVTITISLTNALTGTNLTSLEGQAYTVNPATVTLTELDNAVGGEVVLWSDPMTNALDSTNWTVTFATTSLATNTVLPVVIPNYTNNEGSVYSGGTNDFEVLFGNPVASDNIPVSPAMAVNGWTTALKTSVENNYQAPAGVNVLPQGLKFQGNYALRFSMYLRLYDRALNNPYYTGTIDRQYALFGMNNKGTNCDYRPTAPVYGGSSGTNWDGEWFAIDAGIDAITPADFDAFASPALPNSGGSDIVSNRGEAESGVFKDPPFDGDSSLYGTFGGQPVDQWVEVSAEITGQTNVNLYMNRSQVLSSYTLLSGGGYTNGTIMLGYENPLFNTSDGSAYAYFSNVRVVELSPYIIVQAPGVLATNGQTVTLTNAATFATGALTNVWSLGYTNPLVALQTNSINATNLTSTLSFTAVTGTNYMSVYSDTAGSVTSVVAAVEVILGPTNTSVNAGGSLTLKVTPTGQSAPTAYQWRLNGTAIASATNATYTVSSVTAANAGLYSVSITNAWGSVQPLATVTVVQPPMPVFASSVLSGTNVVVPFTSGDSLATASSFLLLSSPTVNAPLSTWKTNTAAVFTGTNGVFQVVVPELNTNAAMFFILKDKN